MTTPVENVPITLEYLKGKRRAEKALGFLAEIGSMLLACDTVQQVARAIAEHLLRLSVDLCVIDHRPRSGSPVVATAQVPDLGSVVPDIVDIVERCRREAEQLALGKAGPLDRSDTTFDAGGSRIVLQQFAFDYPNVGTGALSVARIRADAPEFTLAELVLLRNVAAQFITSVRCLPG